MTKRTGRILTILLITLFVVSLATSAFANPFKQKGKESTRKFALKPGLYLFEVEHKGYSKFEIWFKDSTGKNIALLAKGVGPYKGTKVVGFAKPVVKVEKPKTEEGAEKKAEDKKKKPAEVKYFCQAVEADGEWVVTIKSTKKKTKKLSFKGDTKTMEATAPFDLKKGSYNFSYLHKGGREFEAVLYNSQGKKIAELAKGVGYMKDTKKVKIPAEGTYIIEVKASGKWTMDVSFGI